MSMIHLMLKWLIGRMPSKGRMLWQRNNKVFRAYLTKRTISTKVCVRTKTWWVTHTIKNIQNLILTVIQTNLSLVVNQELRSSRIHWNRPSSGKMIHRFRRLISPKIVAHSRSSSSACTLKSKMIHKIKIDLRRMLKSQKENALNSIIRASWSLPFILFILPSCKINLGIIKIRNLCMAKMRPMLQ